MARRHESAERQPAQRCRTAQTRSDPRTRQESAGTNAWYRTPPCAAFLISASMATWWKKGVSSVDRRVWVVPRSGRFRKCFLCVSFFNSLHTTLKKRAWWGETTDLIGEATLRGVFSPTDGCCRC